MNKLLVLAALGLSNIGLAADNAPPAFWNCTFYRLVSSDHGGSQQISEGRLELKAATEIERQFPEGKIRGFVCNSDPVSEVDFWIEDTHGNRLTLSTNDPKSERVSLWSTIYLQDGSNVSLGVSCGPSQQTN